MNSRSKRLRIAVRPDDFTLLQACAQRAGNDLVREASLLLAFGIRSSWQRWQQLERGPVVGITQLPFITTPDALREAAADAEAATREEWQTPTDPDDKPPKPELARRSIFRARRAPKAPPPPVA